MLYILIILLIVISFLSFIDFKEKVLYNFFYIILFILLVFIATFRPSTLSDYSEYLKFFNQTYKKVLEPGIYIIRFLSQLISESHFFFFFLLAVLGIFLKLYAIKKLSTQIRLSVILYLSTFFIYHELIQLRAGIATGFFLISLLYIYQRKLHLFLIFASLSSLFHISALIVFPLYFLKPNSFNKLLYLAGFFIVYFLAYMGTYLTNLVEYIPIERVLRLYYSYKNSYPNLKVNIFSSIQLLRISLAVYLILKSEILVLKNKYAFLLLKIYIISIYLLVLFSNFAVIAFRLSQFLQVVEMITLPMLVHTFSKKYDILLSKIAIIFISFVLFYLIAIYKGLLI